MWTSWHRDTCVATHPRQPRHSVLMHPGHDAGLLQVARPARVETPPRHDPRYPVQGEVAVRDLAIYEQLVTEGAA